MNHSIKKLVAGTALVLGAFAAQAAEPIKIGSVLSVTGPAAFLGDPELKTLQMYVDDINKKGGVIGRPLQLVHYDDGSDAGKANGFTKRLIDDDKVDILIGGTTTGATMSAAPLVEKAGIPFISLAGAVVIVEPVKKWIFKTPHTDRMAAEKVFEDMKKRGLTNVALFTETSGFGGSGKKEAEGVAGKYGITLVANETYGPKDTDMSPQLTKIKNTAGVQAVFVIGLGQGPAIVTKNYKQLGIACRSTMPTVSLPTSSSSSPARRQKASACRPRRCWWPTSCQPTTHRSQWSPPTPRPIRKSGRAMFPPLAVTPMTA
jgi:branched-chain amino acid transport system substrate-binding protein